MTIISFTAFIVSFTGMVSFIIWDNDMAGIPILFPFGQFLANWWFHAGNKRNSQANTGNYVLDGPPLVAVTQTSNAVPYPYPGYFGPNSDYNPTIEYLNTHPGANNPQFTPVNGLYGVTKEKSIADANPSTHKWYPQAIEPNDYIAHRLLGDGFNYQDMVSSNTNSMYNTNVFKGGQSPFELTKMTNTSVNDPRWGKMGSYASSTGTDPLLVPLISTGDGKNRQGWDAVGNGSSGLIPMPYVQSTNVYSGGEYTDNASGFAGSLEWNYLAGSRVRPTWDQMYYNGQPIDMGWASSTGVFAGEIYDSNHTNLNEKGMNSTLIAPNFYDPAASGKSTSVPGVTQVSWGDNNSANQNFAYYGDQYGTVRTPSSMQLDYIVGQLSQENPIPFLNNNALQ